MRVICREVRALEKPIHAALENSPDIFRFSFEFVPRQGHSGLSIDSEKRDAYIIGQFYEIHLVAPKEEKKAKK